LVEAAKSDSLKAFSGYLAAVQKTLSGGYASEGAHYPTLKVLLESLGDGIIATILPPRIECGAPDLIVTKGSATVGYVEAKDIGTSLDEIEKTEQLKRYISSLSNLILTDYLEFRWYRDGKRELEANLGTLDSAGKIKRGKKGIEEVARLLAEFFSFEAPGVGTPKELAVRMACLAHRIREGAEEALNKGIASDLLSGLHKAFQATLVPDLEVKVFADMYAQTIAYGLFAARCETYDASKFTLKDATDLIPQTNPFLKHLFYQITGPHLNNEPYKWAADELVQVLKRADMTEIVKGLSRGSGKDDPVVYFYEDFLREYDKKISEMRGVYYTPLPVVSYIVRSIDYLLRNSFKRPQGLADENTYILDPATGTGTFLYAVINEIHESMSKQGQMGKWDGYVAGHLLPRIFGFELLMAPYVIAHLKLGLLLKNTGYTFQSKERLGVYLTNTLEEAVKSSEMLMAQYIANEANTAAEIKKDKSIMVVLGNPPYSVSSLNRGEWIGNLLDDYKQGLHEKKLNIDDDYIRFIRFAQWRIEETGYGILGFITNNSYLDGLTHRRMREYLLETFGSIYILNLHGSSRRGEQAPDNIKDENVFDIQQGVAIGIFVKEQSNAGTQVYYTDIWGKRESKYRTLLELDIASTSWQQLSPTAPYFFFVPKDLSLSNEYEQMPSVKEIFTIWQSALNTDRDELFLDSDRNELGKRIQLFFSKSYGDDFKEKYRVYPSSSYDIEARRDKTKFAETNIHRCLHRPFDECFIYYDPLLTSRPVYEVMRHMLQGNIALVCARQTKEGFAVLATSALCTHKIVTVYDRSFVFPLCLYPIEGEMQFEEGHRRPNLSPEFVKAVSDGLGVTFVEDGRGDLEQTLGPEDIFNYAYAVFHSPTYRTRYTEFLRIDFPRLPLTTNKGLFKSLAAKGAELVSFHLMESPVLNNFITRYPIAGSSTVEEVSYKENNQRVYINKMQYFEGVPPEVWNFHIGGYQVSQKWLKDRKGRTLTYDELTHYQKVVVVLKETIRLMTDIDTLIPMWPLE
jgi:hypothetical protein